MEYTTRGADNDAVSLKETNRADREGDSLICIAPATALLQEFHQLLNSVA